MGAVANSWNYEYPDSPRALHLKTLYTNALAYLRRERPIEVETADEKALFDISLPDIEGREIRLSEACKGKVTLIDFTAYSLEKSPVHNLLLAELYSRYQPKGFEIYQVSLDSDMHRWQNSAVNLPWICVRDPESIYSSIAAKYVVNNLPGSFIMDREGGIVHRVEDYKSIEKELVKYLK